MTSWPQMARPRRSSAEPCRVRAAVGVGWCEDEHEIKKTSNEFVFFFLSFFRRERTQRRARDGRVRGHAPPSQRQQNNGQPPVPPSRRVGRPGLAGRAATPGAAKKGGQGLTRTTGPPRRAACRLLSFPSATHNAPAPPAATRRHPQHAASQGAARTLGAMRGARKGRGRCCVGGWDHAEKRESECLSLARAVREREASPPAPHFFQPRTSPSSHHAATHQTKSALVRVFIGLHAPACKRGTHPHTPRQTRRASSFNAKRPSKKKQNKTKQNTTYTDRSRGGATLHVSLWRGGVRNLPVLRLENGASGRPTRPPPPGPDNPQAGGRAG